MGNIFDILGPVMVGPSSSHTAGAVRIGLIGNQLLGGQPEQATVYLHGSFAATGKGHGTDKAIIAGLMGMRPDDMRIPDSFALAKEQGMDFSIEEKDVKGAHPNTAQLVLKKGKSALKIEACSVGGGRIRVNRLDDIDVNFTGESNTLIVRNVDEPGRIAEVSEVLTEQTINIATMQVFRDKRGGFAVMVVETDQVVPDEAIDKLETREGIIKVTFLNVNRATGE